MARQKKFERATLLNQAIQKNLTRFFGVLTKEIFLCNSNNSSEQILQLLDIIALQSSPIRSKTIDDNNRIIYYQYGNELFSKIEEEDSRSYCFPESGLNFWQKQVSGLENKVYA